MICCCSSDDDEEGRPCLEFLLNWNHSYLVFTACHLIWIEVEVAVRRPLRKQCEERANRMDFNGKKKGRSTIDDDDLVMDALGQKSPGSWAVTGTGIGIDRVASHRLVAGLGWVWVNCRTRESDLIWPWYERGYWSAVSRGALLDSARCRDPSSGIVCRKLRG